MPAALVTSDELTAIRASTRAHLAELREEPGIADDVVGLERIGVALLAAFDAPQTPTELGKVSSTRGSRCSQKGRTGRARRR